MKRSRPKNTSQLVNLLESDQQTRVLSLDTDKVSPRPQARVDFGDIDGLADSINTRGQDNPISVRKSLPTDNVETPYIILTGERRWRACRQLGKPVDAIDKGLTTNRLDTVFEAVENFQRKDLTPFETAALIHNLLQEGLKKGEIAQLLGRTNQFISTHFKLTDPKPEVLEIFNQGHTSDPEALAALDEILQTDRSVAEQIVMDVETSGITRQRLRNILKKLKAGAHTGAIEVNNSDMVGQDFGEFPHAENELGSNAKSVGPNTPQSSLSARKSVPPKPSNSATSTTSESESGTSHEVKIMVLVGQADAYLAELLIESAPVNKVRVRTSNGQEHEVDSEDVIIHKVG